MKSYSDPIHYRTLVSTLFLQNVTDNNTILVQVVCIEYIFHLGLYVVPFRFPYAKNEFVFIKINCCDLIYHMYDHTVFPVLYSTLIASLMSDLDGWQYKWDSSTKTNGALRTFNVWIVLFFTSWIFPSSILVFILWWKMDLNSYLGSAILCSFFQSVS